MSLSTNLNLRRKSHQLSYCEGKEGSDFSERQTHSFERKPLKAWTLFVIIEKNIPQDSQLTNKKTKTRRILVGFRVNFNCSSRIRIGFFQYPLNKIFWVSLTRNSSSVHPTSFEVARRGVTTSLFLWPRDHPNRVIWGPKSWELCWEEPQKRMIFQGWCFFEDWKAWKVESRWRFRVIFLDGFLKNGKIPNSALLMKGNPKKFLHYLGCMV